MSSSLINNLILALERRVFKLDISSAVRRISALEQGAGQLWRLLGDDATCSSINISGTVTDQASVALVGATVAIKDATTSAVLGTTTTTSGGVWSVDVTATATVGELVTITAAKAGFVTQTTAYFALVCGANTTVAIALQTTCSPCAFPPTNLMATLRFVGGGGTFTQVVALVYHTTGSPAASGQPLWISGCVASVAVPGSSKIEVRAWCDGGVRLQVLDMGSFCASTGAVWDTSGSSAPIILNLTSFTCSPFFFQWDFTDAFSNTYRITLTP